MAANRLKVDEDSRCKGTDLCKVFNRKNTVAVPFSFEQRDKLSLVKKEEKVRQVLDEERRARKFHAQPIMKENKIKIPCVEKVPLTKPEPFRFQIDERLENRLIKWQANLEKEFDDQRKATIFKASEPKVLSMAPFEPKPSDTPLSEVSNFILHSDRRAEERKAFDLKVKQKEAEIVGAKRELEERKKREEIEEISKLRKESVHKAQPVRNFKPMEVKPSEKDLTFPCSPKFISGSTRNTKCYSSDY